MLLYVPAGRPADARVFVRRAMGFAEQEIGLSFEQVRSGGLSALGEYVDDPDTVGAPRDVIPATLDERLAAELDADLVNVSEMVLELRAVKDD